MSTVINASAPRKEKRKENKLRLAPRIKIESWNTQENRGNLYVELGEGLPVSFGLSGRRHPETIIIARGKAKCTFVSAELVSVTVCKAPDTATWTLTFRETLGSRVR